VRRKACFPWGGKLAFRGGSFSRATNTLKVQQKKLADAEKIVLWKTKEKHQACDVGALKYFVQKRVDTLKEQEVRAKLQEEAEAAAAAAPRGIIGRLFV